MSTKYVIQFTTNPNFCLGVTSAAPGSPVVLSILQGAGSKLTQWELDANTGLISLVGSPDPQNPLYLDFQGTSPSNGSTVIVSALVLGRTFQKWNWVGNPPYVMNLGAPTYCVDDNSGGTQPGNKIQIWSQQNGNTNQQWQFLAVPVLEQALAVSSR
jgi:hypothetical protein